MARPIRRIVNLTKLEAASCHTSAEWIERFMRKNPRMNWLLVQQAYIDSGAYARFGPMDHQSFQALPGVAPSKAGKRVRQTLKARKELRETEEARYRTMAPKDLAPLHPSELGRALVAKGWGYVQRRSRGGKLAIGALVELDSEVRNGGFHQYFLNHQGSRLEAALGVLIKIGDRTLRRSVERARDIYVEDGLDGDFSNVDNAYLRGAKSGKRIEAVLVAYTRVSGLLL